MVAPCFWGMQLQSGSRLIMLGLKVAQKIGKSSESRDFNRKVIRK